MLPGGYLDCQHRLEQRQDGLCDEDEDLHVGVVPAYQTKKKADSQAGSRREGDFLNPECFPLKNKEKSQTSAIFTKLFFYMSSPRFSRKPPPPQFRRTPRVPLLANWLANRPFVGSGTERVQARKKEHKD